MIGKMYIINVRGKIKDNVLSKVIKLILITFWQIVPIYNAKEQTDRHSWVQLKIELYKSVRIIIKNRFLFRDKYSFHFVALTIFLVCLTGTMKKKL